MPIWREIVNYIRDFGWISLSCDFIVSTNSCHQREMKIVFVMPPSGSIPVFKITNFSFWFVEMASAFKPIIGRSSHHILPSLSKDRAKVRDKWILLSLSILRLLEEEALKDTKRSTAPHCASTNCSYLLNENHKASNVMMKRKRYNVRIILFTPNEIMENLRTLVFSVFWLVAKSKWILASITQRKFTAKWKYWEES